MGAPHYSAILGQGSENVPEAKYMRPMEAADIYTASAGSASISTMDYSLKPSDSSLGRLDDMKGLYKSSVSASSSRLGGSISDELGYSGISGISTPVPERAISPVATDVPKMSYNTSTALSSVAYK